MQRDAGQPDAAGGEPREKVVGEMQPRRGCCRRAGRPGEDRLIAVAIPVFLGATADVARQRYATDAVEEGVSRLLREGRTVQMPPGPRARRWRMMGACEGEVGRPVGWQAEGGKPFS